MLDIINPILRFLLDYPAIFFAGLGYFTGYLFRNTNLLKIAIAFFLIPYSLEWLVHLNWVWQGTLPYLVFAVVGFFGHDKAGYRLNGALYAIKNLVLRR